MRTVAERYLLLGLRLGRVLDGVVDGYFGPPELGALADNAGLPEPGLLLEEAVSLRDEIERSELDQQRRRWLAAQVEALVCVAEIATGTTVAWKEAVRRCYGIEVAVAAEERFEQAHARLDAVLPGRGALADRLERWNESQRVPPEKLLDGFSALTEELRRCTRRLVDLPDGEEIEAEIVSDKPWRAYNWYRGQLRSRIEINTDLPVQSYSLAIMAAHEGYPGHHTEHACKEARLVDDLGRLETSILLIHTPECLISEGIAQVALLQALGKNWAEQVAEILHPLAIPFDPDVSRVVVDAAATLDNVSVNVAHFAHERGWDIDELVGYQRRWALSGEDRARHEVAFITHPFWSAYIPTYSVGYRLVHRYAARQSENMRRLLTEQLTTADLITGDTPASAA